MADPISVIAGGVTITQGLLKGLDFILGLASADVISAYFKYNGARIEGNEKIEVVRNPSKDNDSVWWFNVKPVDDYVFVRYPVIESCVHEMVGTVENQENPDPTFWRWIALERPGVIVDGGAPPNVKVDFVVVGYKPKALITHFSS